MGSSVQLTVQSTLTRMPNIKLTYFDLRARAEPCRLLLAYGGLKYEDERIPPPWDPASTWATVKPTTPFGQLPYSSGAMRSSASQWPVQDLWLVRLVSLATLAWRQHRWTRSLMSSKTSLTLGSNCSSPKMRLVRKIMPR